MALIPGRGELDGLELGAGTPYTFELLDAYGLEVDGYTTRRPLADGADAGPDYLPEKRVLGVVSIRDSATEDLGDLTDALVAAFAPVREGSVLLRYWRISDDAPRRLYVRPRRVRIAVDNAWWAHGVAKNVPFELVAPDPRWYADVEDTVTLTLPTAETGRTYPRTYPLAYGGGVSGGDTATNAGNYETFPVVTISGPITNPRLENVTTGETIELAITVASGDTLTLDHDAETVMLNGTASRYGSIVGTPEWWALVPGPNELKLGADAYDAAASAEVRWRSAWAG